MIITIFLATKKQTLNIRICVSNTKCVSKMHYIIDEIKNVIKKVLIKEKNCFKQKLKSKFQNDFYYIQFSRETKKIVFLLKYYLKLNLWPGENLIT